MLGGLARLLSGRGIHIDAFSVIDNVEYGMVRLMTSDPKTARAVLKSAGFQMIEAAVLPWK
jgi:hypothetical protein